MHDLDLILNLTVGLSLGLVLGFVTHRFGLSPILGYLLAGVLVGPHTPGFVADPKLASQFAEIGVILLMFGVGLHFHMKDLLAVRWIAIPGAVGQSVIATALGTLVAVAFGWSASAGVVLGIAISVASTVVLIRVLLDNNALETPAGHVAVGWLIVEDIFTVIILVMLPALVTSFQVGGPPMGILSALGIAVLKLGVLVVLMLFFGARLVPWLLTQVARSRSKELFTLTVLVLALAIATGSALFFGASMALGAFLAGMVVSQSSVSHQAAADALPMRDAFAVLFFVSVGMLFDPHFIVAEPWLVLSVLAVILVAKPIAALLIVTVLGYSVRTALTVAIGLAQIGEFSFILAEVARRLGVLPQEGQTVLVAGALISISLNPLLFRAVGPVEKWLRGRPGLWHALNRRAEARGREASTKTAAALAQDEGKIRAIVVGFGPVGQTLAQIVRDFNVTPVIIDLNVDTVATVSASGQPAIYGDASQREVLQGAGIEKAKYLLVTLPDMASRIPVILSARSINPDVKIFVRARHIAERDELEKLGATAVCYEEAEVAVGLAEFLLREVGADDRRIEEEADKIRAKFAVRKPGSVSS